VKSEDVLLQVENLHVYFPVTQGIVFQHHIGDVKAVDDLSFEVYRGETLGLVGESGCGKSTTGRGILQLIRPTSGRVTFDGTEITSLSTEELRPMRKQMQMVFQDPYSSLNPRMPVIDTISEPMLAHGLITRKQKEERVQELLHMVGLNPGFINRFPFEFSGGQRQRIGIARSISLDPDFVICDEPISALDVSIQAQVLNLLLELQEKLSLTYLFIAHDISVIRHISDRVAVMYLGKIVELAECEEIFRRTLHPYTEGLFSAIPIPKPAVEKKRKRIIMEGDLPSPSDTPIGCNFNTRCPYVMDVCREVEPPLVDVGSGHYVACHLHPGPSSKTEESPQGTS
jgi:oligopeptide transport system ATP-binding protein